MLRKECFDIISSGIYLLDLKVHEAWMRMKITANPKDYDQANMYFADYFKKMNQFGLKIKFVGERSELDKFTASDVLIFSDIEKIIAKNDELQVSLLSSIVKDLDIFDRIYSNSVESKVALQEVKEYIKANLTSSTS